ncbi:uncharacterized protein LOC131691093 [Topomyia yanbarensis]|uniref:uncharacterized protein LOC131691093 n=1 Tax=Topomyia yanbarensis TaxID=2498891 RepID=UPI00273B80A5|nr:uncharacterized protein LOC131691093 [Topomyia yanbarensis]
MDGEATSSNGTKDSLYNKFILTLHEDTRDKLNENGVTFESIAVMKKQDLREMEITKKGLLVLILDFIEKAKRTITSHDDWIESSAPVNSAFPIHEIKAALEQNPQFRNIYTSKLLMHVVLEHNELLRMTRVICDHFFGKRVWTEQNYPTRQEKMLLAQRIVQAFPQLIKKVTEDAPIESAFFFKHNGQLTGPHSGYIEQRVTNMRKEIPRGMQKFKRTNGNESVEDVSDEMVAVAEMCTAMEATPQNSREISIALKNSFVIHKNMITQKKNVKF